METHASCAIHVEKLRVSTTEWACATTEWAHSTKRTIFEKLENILRNPFFVRKMLRDSAAHSSIGCSMPSWYAPDANPTAAAPERTHWDHGWIDPPKHVADKHGPPPFLWYGSVHVGKVFKPDLRKRAISRVYNAALTDAGLSAQVTEVIDDRTRGLVACLSRNGCEDDARVREVLGAFTRPWKWAEPTAAE